MASLISRTLINFNSFQVSKTKALRDRHTLTARDLGDIPSLIESDMNVAISPATGDVCDKNFAALVEKYSANEKVTMEGKFHSARSVFESTSPAHNPTSKSAMFKQ